MPQLTAPCGAGTINDKIYSAPGLASDPHSSTQINPGTMRQTARLCQREGFFQRCTFPSPFPAACFGGLGWGGVSVCDRCFTKLELAKLVSRKILGKVGVGRGGGGVCSQIPRVPLSRGASWLLAQRREIYVNKGPLPSDALEFSFPP